MGRTATGRPTSFDIAYLAGVSQPTVSRALRGDSSVSPKTRQRIEQIARELNYTVDKNASSLRSQRSNTIALLFFEDPTPDESMINPFYLSMLGSITRACAARGLDLLISFQQQENDWHARYQDSHRADGLILLGYGGYSSYRKKLEQLEAQGTHYARWGSVSRDEDGRTVGSDNVGAGRTVGQHLLRLGRRRIVFLGETGENSPELDGRYRGLLQAVEDAGLPPDAVRQSDAITTEQSGFDAMTRVLGSGAPPDAVFAASDLVAIGAMRALGAAGLRVPEDVAVVGFDDIPAASHSNPPLTTISQDIKGAGDRLVEALLCQIDGREAPPNRLATRLVVRDSSGGKAAPR